jgi:rhodanese-related sulfurtransferase
MPAATALHDAAPATLKAWLERDEAILVDVREADEYAREHIAGARLHPLSGLSAATLPRVPGKKLVLQCNSGNRTRQAAAAIRAREALEIYHLAGGIQAWKRAGLPVEVDRAAPLPIMRQAQIAAGSLVLLGLLLALIISPWFALLSAGIGVGLVVAGLTGHCGMAKLLERLPYNRRGPHAAASG